MLTGKYNDGIPEGSRFANNADMMKSKIEALQGEEGQSKIRRVKDLTKIAEELGGTTVRGFHVYIECKAWTNLVTCIQTQLSLAWAAKNPNVSTVILGATKPQQVHDNCGAIKLLPKMTPEIMERIESVLGNKPGQ